MPIRQTLSLALLSAVFVLFSCKKDRGVPQTPHTISFNSSYPVTLYYPWQVTDFELIVTGPGEKILLDSILPINTPIHGSVQTTATLIDVTTIYKLKYRHGGAIDSIYEIMTYKAVDPSNWPSLAPLWNWYIPPSNAAYNLATMIYTHPPSSTAPVYFNSGEGGGYGFLSKYIPGNDLLQLSYERYNNYYGYLLFPTLGLYNFHIPTGDTDTADLSHMDTVVRYSFNRPARCTLTGFMDSTDLSKPVTLYSPNLSPGLPHLEYPAKYVQKYELSAYFSSNSGPGVTMYSFGDTVPKTFSFPDEPSFAVTSKQSDYMTVKFQTIQPTYYALQVEANIQSSWTIYAPKDSTVIRPMPFLLGLKSQTLKDAKINQIFFNGITLGVVKGFSYASYLDYMMNPAAIASGKITSAVVY